MLHQRRCFASDFSGSLKQRDQLWLRGQVAKIPNMPHPRLNGYHDLRKRELEERLEKNWKRKSNLELKSKLKSQTKLKQEANYPCRMIKWEPKQLGAAFIALYAGNE